MLASLVVVKGFDCFVGVWWTFWVMFINHVWEVFLHGEKSLAAIFGDALELWPSCCSPMLGDD